MADECLVCTLEVHDVGVGCEGPCKGWFHPACTDMTVDYYNFLCKNPETKWMCESCATNDNDGRNSLCDPGNAVSSPPKQSDLCQRECSNESCSNTVKELQGANIILEEQATILNQELSKATLRVNELQERIISATSGSLRKDTIIMQLQEKIKLLEIEIIKQHQTQDKFRIVSNRSKRRSCPLISSVALHNSFEVLSEESQLDMASVEQFPPLLAPSPRQIVAGTSENGRTNYPKSGASAVDGCSQGGKKKNKVLILGDSMVRHASYTSSRMDCATETFPGIKPEQLRCQIKNVSKNYEGTKCVVLHVGTNCVKSRAKADEIMGDVWAVVREVKEQFDDVKVAVTGLLHRRDVPHYLNEKIDSINSSLDWMCEREGCVFVNTNQWIGDWGLGRDGLHLNRKGSRKLGFLLANVGISCVPEGNC